jgi:hypothetical protein
VDGDEEHRVLPQEEFVDFLSTYEDQNRYWAARTDESGECVEPLSENDFPTLTELMAKESNF